jgi:CysZ protein
MVGVNRRYKMAGSGVTISFVEGLHAPFQGLDYLWRHRGLWKYVWIPFLVNVFLYFGLGAAFIGLYPSMIGHILPEGHAWYVAALRVLLWIAGSALIGVMFLFSFTVVGNIIAGPFSDLLSERVEAMILKTAPPHSPGLGEQLGSLGRNALEETKRLLFFLAGSLLLLLLALIPAAGPFLYSVASGAWTLLFLALEFGDYYLMRHSARFRARWSHIWGHRWQSLGFGAGAALLLLIPIANLLLIPGAVTGGTLLWIRLAPPGAKGLSAED